ncbi:MAG: hypothetical protein GF308_16490 [Candidatus Heimdallarchaeota archaeon]|nr:hypothetical protein [Candidatus Heimdallarchaeota archaeon]
MNVIIANRIINLVSGDPAKIAVLALLADGKWHTRYELESVAKEERPTIGIVGICMILNALQEADEELLETYENNSGLFFRLNAHRKNMIARIIQALNKKKGKEPQSSSGYQYQKFKERLKAKKDQLRTGNLDDEDLKQFL